MACLISCAGLMSAVGQDYRELHSAQQAQPETKAGAALNHAFLFRDAGADLALGFNNNEPAIAVDPNNPLHVAVATYLTIRVSVDGGNTFLPGVTAGIPPTHSGSRGGDSSLAFDSQGRLFWTYLLITNGPTASDFDIFLAQCNPTTGALLPGYPVNITASAGVNLPAPANSHDKEWLAIDTNPSSPFRDRIHVVWTQFPSSGTRVLSTFSSDQGTNWSAPVTLSGSGEGFVWPSHNAVAPNGDVYAAYHSQPTFDSSGAPNGTSGRIYILRSTDGGATFPLKTQAFTAGQADLTFNRQIQNGAIPGARFWLQGSVQPWVLPDPKTPGRIYVIANDDPDNNHSSGDNAAIFIATSTDFGTNWAAPRQIDAGPGVSFQVMPTANIDPVTGCITVHYYDNRNGQTNASGNFLLDVFATRSQDGGVTFGPEVQINDTAFDPDANPGCRWECGTANATTRIGEYNGVAVVGDIAYAVWTGNTFSGGTANGQQTIFDRLACEACTLTCPANITVGNDSTQCGAVVTYSSPTATGGCGPVVCTPASGTFFPVGSTTVTCTGLLGDSCSFSVTVQDREAPVVSCVQTTNPDGTNIPQAGNNPASGFNPDGFCQVLAKDNCDPNPLIYIRDSASPFIAGPFASGDKLKFVQARGAKPNQKPGAGVIIAMITLNGDPLIVGVDADNNISAPLPCLVPPPPK